MKKFILSIFALIVIAPFSRADEGMWIPMLIGKNYEEMQRLGLKLTAEDLYHANNSSLKDAIVHFGGGCTGEIISDKGLLITNHHCGYGNIAVLSTVTNNYLENGFWSKSLSEEIPAPGLTVKFLVSMEDVTEELQKVSSKGSKDKRNKALEKAIESLEKKASQGGKYSAQVASYFAGNQYILLVYQIFNDIRLVATPPKSLGKYGGDTDNWIWPRHTADFAVFRVYADKNNNPAAYSTANVPYKPKHFLPVSNKGVKENDFAMIMGYPGRTNRYETSYGVDLAISESNPSVVNIRDMRLSLMRKYMRNDPAINLQLASQYAQIANYWKYYIGQTEQLKRLNVIREKQKQEKEFLNWAKINDPGSQNIMSEFQKVHADYKPYAKHTVYYSECFRAPGIVNLALQTNELQKLLSAKKKDRDAIAKEIKILRASKERIMKVFVPALEKEMLARTAEMFYKDINKSQHPEVYQKIIFKQFGSEDWTKTFNDYANYVFLNTFFLNESKFESFCNNPTLEQLENDPAVVYANSFNSNFEKYYLPKYMTYVQGKSELNKQYIKSLMKKNKGQLMYPDANSTMRVAYGSVGGYNPQDAVTYKYYTTIEGLLAKYKPADYEFDLPADFLDLANSKDYGRYADENGDLVTCFITNNDITGGNSGSPIINANGELTGLAFDGNWEAMSGDIAFDKKYKRTIAVDIRFVLWLIDKYGKAGNIIDEMTIVE